MYKLIYNLFEQGFNCIRRNLHPKINILNEIVNKEKQKKAAYFKILKNQILKEKLQL